MANTTDGRYTIADHIIMRLAALGAKHVFCVPGNYCAGFLDALPNRLEYIGTTNEMEAGYAADAYARLRGIGVACVTYGVGSFGLLNAIAGAFVERCPVVLLNGTAKADKARQLVDQGVLFAHAIDPMRTDEEVFRPVTVATAIIHSPADASLMIDRALRACISEKRPVYIEVQDGVWTEPCDRPTDPDKPLPAFAPDEASERDRRIATAKAAQAVIDRVRQARHPLLWAGEELQRQGLQDAFETLLKTTGLPYATTLLGKGVVSEDNPGFVGVYDSVWAPDDTRTVVEGSDCLLALGTIMTDFYGSIVAKSYDRMVLAAGDAVRVGRALYPQVALGQLIAELIGRWGARTQDAAAGFVHSPPPGFDAARRMTKLENARLALAASPPAADAPITWDSFFERMKPFVSEEMLLLADTSLSLFPASELPVRRRSHFIAEAAWLSIGYTLGAAVGASMAMGAAARVVAFAGDGGFQTIPQAFSTLARKKTSAIVFVFDNGLYGIEQFLVDQTYYRDKARAAAFFNELPRWNYPQLAEAFGGVGFAPATMGELEETLRMAARLSDRPALIAVKLDPRTLPSQIARTLPPAGPVALVARADAARAAIATAAFD
jgi:indolepyruvate decarboxylase